MKDGDVRITKAEEVPKGFNARFDAVGKKYIYKIRNADHMPVFLRNYRYRVWRKLDLDAMGQATGLSFDQISYCWCCKDTEFVDVNPYREETCH